LLAWETTPTNQPTKHNLLLLRAPPSPSCQLCAHRVIRWQSSKQSS
jgi:hypothetical protein